ncbi:hypothetical protein BpHYR1_005349 [Brachionus plicatilis]|uniref:Uncharacterized protein n=1 Tax=Brachionus plicatilis TaxID=10195 RepID=A0A3M7R4R6_BRAPC|nr:hypothetical protein BpHYR1_005349 [Brachionus plicatilis]
MSSTSLFTDSRDCSSSPNDSNINLFDANASSNSLVFLETQELSFGDFTREELNILLGDNKLTHSFKSTKLKSKTFCIPKDQNLSSSPEVELNQLLFFIHPIKNID